MADFGAMLKEWRAIRRMSQLMLAVEADVSPRHIAFLETGRARPSREMVLRLAETLGLPLGERNRLLGQAGFAPVWGRRGLDDGELAQVRAGLERLMAGHDPWPAVVIDRRWRLVDLNAAAARIFGGFGLGPGASLIAAVTDPGPVRDALVNRGEVLRNFSQRLRAESVHLGGDPVLDAALRRLAADPEAAPLPAGPAAAVMALRFRAGGAVLGFFTMIAQFGTVEDVAVSELRLELFFPADRETEAALAAPAQPPSPGTPKAGAAPGSSARAR